jgi:hypothetical protein
MGWPGVSVEETDWEDGKGSIMFRESLSSLSLDYIVLGTADIIVTCYLDS